MTVAASTVKDFLLVPTDAHSSIFLTSFYILKSFYTDSCGHPHQHLEVTRLSSLLGWLLYHKMICSRTAFIRAL